MGTVRTPNAVVFVDEGSIRERAYQIWESRGRPDATSEENWHLARAELMAEAESRLHAEAASSEPAPGAPAKTKRRARSGAAKQERGGRDSSKAQPEPAEPPAHTPAKVAVHAGIDSHAAEVATSHSAKPKAADGPAEAAKRIGKRKSATADRFAVELTAAGGRPGPATSTRERSGAAPATPASAAERAHDTPLPPAARATRKKGSPARRTKSLRPSAEGTTRRGAKSPRR